MNLVKKAMAWMARDKIKSDVAKTDTHPEMPEIIVSRTARGEQRVANTPGAFGKCRGPFDCRPAMSPAEMRKRARA